VLAAEGGELAGEIDVEAVAGVLGLADAGEQPEAGAGVEVGIARGINAQAEGAALGAVVGGAEDPVVAELLREIYEGRAGVALPLGPVGREIGRPR